MAKRLGYEVTAILHRDICIMALCGGFASGEKKLGDKNRKEKSKHALGMNHQGQIHTYIQEPDENIIVFAPGTDVA